MKRARKKKKPKNTSAYKKGGKKLYKCGGKNK